MWLKPSGGKRGWEMSGGWTKSTPKSSWTFTKKLKFIPVFLEGVVVLSKGQGAFNLHKYERTENNNKQIIHLHGAAVSFTGKGERNGYSANWLLLVKDFLQIHLNTPSIILLSVEYLLGFLAFQVVEF